MLHLRGHALGRPRLHGFLHQLTVLSQILLWACPLGKRVDSFRGHVCTLLPGLPQHVQLDSFWVPVLGTRVWSLHISTNALLPGGLTRAVPIPMSLLIPSFFPLKSPQKGQLCLVLPVPASIRARSWGWCISKEMEPNPRAWGSN